MTLIKSSIKIQTNLWQSRILVGMVIIIIDLTSRNVDISNVLFLNLWFPFDQNTFPIVYTKLAYIFITFFCFSCDLRRWYFNIISKRSSYYSNCIHKRYQTRIEITEWPSEIRTPKLEGNSIGTHWDHQILLKIQTVEYKNRSDAHIITPLKIFHLLRLNKDLLDILKYILTTVFGWCLLSSWATLLVFQSEIVKHFILIFNFFSIWFQISDYFAIAY